MRTSYRQILFVILTAALFTTPIFPAVAAEVSEHMKAGQALFQSKMYRAAISEFEQATVEHPDDATAHYYLAVAHVHAGNTDKALPHFQQAVSLSTPGSQVHQMASSAVDAYRGQTASAVTSASPYSYTATSSAGPLVPTHSYNGGASASANTSYAGPAPMPYTPAYRPNPNFSPSNFSQAPQALYPQNYNNIPGYQNGGNNQGSGAWGTSSGGGALWGASPSGSGALWGSSGRSRSGSWGTRHGGGGGGGGGSYTNNTNYLNYNYGGGNGGNACVTPTLAIYNSSASVPITKDMTAADQALTMIKRQSDTQVRNATNGVNMEYYRSSYNNQADQIRQDAQAQINRMLTPTYHGRRGYYSTATQAQIDFVNYQAGARIFNARRDTDRAEYARQVQQATSEAAANLSDQIRNQKLTGSGIMLRAEGTNLNVRNYETFHSDQDDRDAILPLVAHPLTLKEAEKVLPVKTPTVPTKHYSIDQ